MLSSLLVGKKKKRKGFCAEFLWLDALPVANQQESLASPCTFCPVRALGL